MPEPVRTCPWCATELGAGESSCPACEQRVPPPPRPAAGGPARALTFCTVVLVMTFWFFGFVGQLVGGILVGRDPRFGLWMLFGGGALMSLALTLVSRMKGRGWGWGLLGFASFAGLLAVFFLGRRCYRCGTAPPGGAGSCPSCGEPL